ncbi:MAG: ATP-dependent helicase [Oscillospiraceae bacterium]
MDYQSFKEKFNISLTPQQEEAVRCSAPSTLLLAVPGSGKTTVLVTRLGYMLNCRNIPPESILTMTYTVSAAADMRERFRSIFGGDASDRLEFRTINGVCAMIILYYSRLRGSTAFRLLDKNSKLISDVWRGVNGTIPSESDIKGLQTQITYAKNMMLKGEELAELKLDGADFIPLYNAYNGELRRQGLMDYDDQLVYAHTILRRYPEILEYFRRRWRHICVDEAQDTSKIQHEIIRLLSGGSIFMVGDEDQSIYGFRAACPDALLSFEQTYPGAKVLLMEENFRSSPEIVSAADIFIKRNAMRRDKHMTTGNPACTPIEVLPLKSRLSQYYELAKLLRSCPGGTAVLYRNNDSAIPLIDMFDRLCIPYSCRGMDSSFFSHYILRDVADFVYFSNNPFDKDVFMTLYYKLNCRISKEETLAAIRLSEAREGGSFLLTLAQMPGISSRKGEKLLELNSALYALRGDSPAQAVSRIRYELGYGEYLLRRGADTERLSILQALAAQEPDFSSLMGRLDELKRLCEAGGGDTGAVFSTIHSSKGLEYDHVILIDVIDGILPCIDNPDAMYMTPDNAKTLEEERRLFYVGVTRAKHRLTLLTYRGLDSAFVRQLTSRDIPLKSPPQRRYSPSAAVPQAIKWSEKDFVAGAVVMHKVFGRCVITDSKNGCIRLRLPDGSEKTLLLSACLSGGLIALIPD